MSTKKWVMTYLEQRIRARILQLEVDPGRLELENRSISRDDAEECRHFLRRLEKGKEISIDELLQVADILGLGISLYLSPKGA